jgi:hypothetical protein
MFRKELLILGGVALLVFLIVAGSASLAVRAVQRDGAMLAKDTLPGLVTASEAINRMDENWFNLHLLLTMDSPEARDALIRRIRSNSTETIWRLYQEAIFDEQDAQLFREVKASRAIFIEARDRYIGLMRSGDTAAAKELLATDLSRAFESYRAAAKNILKLNADVGHARADRLIQLSSWVPFALAAFCVMVLLIGVFVGFKASLGAFSGGWTENSSVARGDGDKA